MSERLSAQLASEHERRVQSHVAWRRYGQSSRISRPESSRPSLVEEQVDEDEDGNDRSGLEQKPVAAQYSVVQREQRTTGAQLGPQSKLGSQPQHFIDDGSKLALFALCVLVVVVVVVLSRHPNICAPLNIKFRGMLAKNELARGRTDESKAQNSSSRNQYSYIRGGGAGAEGRVELPVNTVEQMLRFA